MQRDWDGKLTLGGSAAGTRKRVLGGGAVGLLLGTGLLAGSAMAATPSPQWDPRPMEVQALARPCQLAGANDRGEPTPRGSSAEIYGGSSADRYGGSSADRGGVGGPRDRRHGGVKTRDQIEEEEREEALRRRAAAKEEREQDRAQQPQD